MPPAGVTQTYIMIAITLALLAAGSAFDKYQADNETTCMGKASHAFDKPDVWKDESGFTFTVTGGKATVKAEGAQKDARIGLLAAVKDFSPDTQANLKQFITAFRKAGVSAIIVDGDSAYGVDDQDSTITDLFTWLGETDMPVYGIIGNSESRSSFNR